MNNRIGKWDMRIIPKLCAIAALVAMSAHGSSLSAAELGVDLLTPEQLVDIVLERNPGLSGARELSNAAVFRVAPAGALDDPKVGYRIAPESVGASGINTGQMVEITQPLPWFGTLSVRENVARANAQAQAQSSEAVRLNVIESAKVAFAEWYFVHEAIRLNVKQQELVKDLIGVAQARFAAGDGLQQDVLRAETELALLEDQALGLSAARAAAASRINALTNSDTNAFVPPPSPLTIPLSLPDIENVLDAAAEYHPEIARAEAMVSASRSKVRLAEKEFYPSFGVSTGYNSLMPGERMRWTVGVSLNIPLNRGKRQSSLSAARADERAREFKLIDRRAQLHSEITSVHADVTQVIKSIALIEGRILPLAQQTLDVSISEYRSGAGDFLSVITAERNALTTEQSLYRARADLFRQLAALERAAGGQLNDRPVAQLSTLPKDMRTTSEGTLP